VKGSVARKGEVLLPGYDALNGHYRSTGRHRAICGPFIARFFDHHLSASILSAVRSLGSRRPDELAPHMMGGSSQPVLLAHFTAPNQQKSTTKKKKKEKKRKRKRKEKKEKRKWP
jgi:hypothetical protein